MPNQTFLDDLVTDQRPPSPLWRRGLLLLVAVGVLVTATYIFASSDEPVAVPAAHDHNDPTVAHDHALPVAPAEETDTHAHLGDSVVDGNFQFTVVNAETGVPTLGGVDEFTVTAKSSYTVVEVTVKNMSDEPQRYFAETTTGITADGHESALDPIATSYANEGNDAWLNPVDPGDSISTAIAFDIDEPVKTIVLRDAATSHGVTVTL